MTTWPALPLSPLDIAAAAVLLIVCVVMLAAALAPLTARRPGNNGLVSESVLQPRRARRHTANRRQ